MIGIGCYFLSGTSPGEEFTRLALSVAATMLRDKETRSTFTFGHDDELVGEGQVSTGNAFVMLGFYGGVQVDILMEVGPRRYESSVIVTPGFAPERFLEGGAFITVPREWFAHAGGPPVAEA